MSDRIKAELLTIKEASPDGLLYAPSVVDWARTHPESALYHSIEWDDAVAAEEHRIWQVRRLIQLHVVSSDGAPQLVSLSFDRKMSGGYRAISDVLKSRDLTDIMVSDALGELQRVQMKFAHIQELASVWTEVQAAVTRRSRRRAAVAEQHAPAG